MIDPHDLEESVELYKTVWKFITNCQFDEIKSYLESVGEFWLETIIFGQSISVSF